MTCRVIVLYCVHCSVCSRAASWVRMEILCWDPMAAVQMVLPAAEIPVHCGEFDGKTVLRIMDAFMVEAHYYVKALVFDAATPHLALRRICFGLMTQQDKELLRDPSLRFFPRLAYKPLPAHDLPRLPVNVPFFEGEPFFALCGPCAVSKMFQAFQFLKFFLQFVVCAGCCISGFWWQRA